MKRAKAAAAMSQMTENYKKQFELQQKIDKANQQPGYSIIPLRVFINERGLAKAVIAIAKVKKMFDKRQSIKEREDKKSMARVLKRG